ncbi:MAG TPA: RraA family protein [Methanothermococcus okinawensis]|uniref:RraA family protein n=1 Tax=Methanothermococcus okinawensis TaxID=155863 RepID=A0A832ZE91_9EURY|nr:RraA family protein [Methanococcaceae archaeon]HIP84963.1 RraA family protein [Methanothermococcus okinawensis]HIP91275.1 RraA family protein [Methanothermococcus okinawensis]
MNILKDISVPNLSDAGAKVLKGIKPLDSMQGIVFGEAFTVKTSSEDWGTVVKAISYSRGKVIVVECEGEECAVWGGLASLNAKLKGVVAVVIDGYVRDLEDIRRTRFPVFSRGYIAKAGSPLDRGVMGVPVICGDTTVNPGDIVVGDCNGVVVIDRNRVGEIVERVKEIKKKESRIRDRIMRGMDLKDILKLE